MKSLEGLADYSVTNRGPSRNTPLSHEDANFDHFCSLCEESWRESLALVAQAQALQQNRNKKRENSSLH